MPWSMSHSLEACQNLKNNIFSLPIKELIVIYGEIHAGKGEKDAAGWEESFDEKRYNEALEHAKELDKQSLAEFIFDFAMEQGICTVGGFSAWVCPYGCGIHLVSMEKKAVRDENGRFKPDH